MVREEEVHFMISDPDAETSTMAAQQRRGRAILLAIFLVLLGGDLLITALEATAKGFDNAGPSVVRILLTLVLMYLVWTGRGWARWLMVCLLFVAALALLSMLLAHPNPLLLALLIGVVLAALLIGFSPSVRSFLVLQRERR
jgi:hypothetical protein